MESRVYVDEWKVECMWMKGKQSGCGWMESRVYVDEWKVECMWMNGKQSVCGWMKVRMDVEGWKGRGWINGCIDLQLNQQ